VRTVTRTGHLWVEGGLPGPRDDTAGEEIAHHGLAWISECRGDKADG